MLAVALCWAVVAAAPAPSPVPLTFEGNVVMPDEVYSSVLELASEATGFTMREPETAREFIEEHLLGFLRASGYLLATVEVEDHPKGGLRVRIDEGRLDRVLVVGQGVVRTLELQLTLDLPKNVFNRYVIERQLADLVRRRNLESATYEVVPTEAVDHPGIQLTPSALLGGNVDLAPGEPHELRISLSQPTWRTGWGVGVGYQSPDGFYLSGRYRGRSAIIDGDRFATEAQIAFRLPEALFSSNSNIGLTRARSNNRWYARPVMSSVGRPFLELDVQLQSRFRGDVGIQRYYFAPIAASANFAIEPTKGLEIAVGGGAQFRALFDVSAEEGATLQVTTEERTFRAFFEVEADWRLDPDELRRDRQERLLARAQYVSGSGRNFDDFTRFVLRYDKVLLFGYDELWLGVDGGLFIGDVPFYDEAALGDGFVRASFGGDFFTRKAASLSAEYRLSLSREALKISLFNDAAIFEELALDRTSLGAQFADNVGVGLHFLLLNAFQVNIYTAVGFVPDRDPQLGLSIQVTQAF